MKIFILIISLLSLGNSYNLQTTCIEGNWVLVAVDSGGKASKHTSYSTSEILYNFQVKGILTVSAEQTNLFQYHPKGEYTYTIKEDDKNTLTVRIGKSDWACHIFKNDLILTKGHVDGPTLSFKKSPLLDE